MARHTSDISNFRPQFPAEAVERYPSLTLALGSDYPGLRIPTADHETSYHAAPGYLLDHDAPPTAFDMPVAPPHMFPTTPASSPLDAIHSETPVASRNNSPFPNNWPILQNLSMFSGGVQPGNLCFSPEASTNPSDENSSFGDDDFGPIYQDHTIFSITALSDLRTSPRAKATNAGSWNHHSANFIPIRNDPSVTSTSKEHDLQPPAVKSKPLWVPVMTYATAGYDNFKTVTGPPRRIPVKPHRCPRCPKTFARPCDVKTHLYTHTGERPFRCPARGCRKRYGVRSNMLRHSLEHGFPRTGPIRPIGPYNFGFENHPSLPVRSDSTPMRTQLVWVAEGPLSTRQALVVPRSRTVEPHN
ncbi:hypothetical protein FB451DRAFT_61817 [Mycena latifolia]|nr:hypothetical protein FB451DRAFT_61817 [Mycena latifolia]